MALLSISLGQILDWRKNSSFSLWLLILVVVFCLCPVVLLAQDTAVYSDTPESIEDVTLPLPVYTGITESFKDVTLSLF